MTLIFDPKGDGLGKVFRDYQEEALGVVWQNGEGATSRVVWERVNDKLDGGRSISRASIINFLNAMVDEGVLDYHEETGKGGYHRVYEPMMDESELKKFIAKTVISSLMKDFPEETTAAIEGLT